MYGPSQSEWRQLIGCGIVFLIILLLVVFRIGIYIGGR